jgi:hypothetical protein
MTETVMRGHGYYNTHSELQARTAAVSDPALEAALQGVAIPEFGPITIADFGCSQGRNSLHPMDRALTVIGRRAGAGREFIVVHINPATISRPSSRSLRRMPRAIAAGARMFSASPLGGRSTSRCCRPAASPSAGLRSRCIG